MKEKNLLAACRAGKHFVTISPVWMKQLAVSSTKLVSTIIWQSELRIALIHQKLRNTFKRWLQQAINLCEQKEEFFSPHSTVHKLQNPSGSKSLSRTRGRRSETGRENLLKTHVKAQSVRRTGFSLWMEIKASRWQLCQFSCAAKPFLT